MKYVRTKLILDFYLRRSKNVLFLFYFFKFFGACNYPPAHPQSLISSLHSDEVKNLTRIFCAIIAFFYSTSHHFPVSFASADRL